MNVDTHRLTMQRVVYCFRHHPRRPPLATGRRYMCCPKSADASHLQTRTLYTSSIFLKNYRKIRTLLTPWNNRKKLVDKKQKYPLDLRKKKVDPESHMLIILYKNVKIQKNPSNVSCVVSFLFKGMKIIILCNKYVKILF